MRRHTTDSLALVMMAAMLSSLPCGSSHADNFTPGGDSFYVSDEVGFPFNPPTLLGTVSKFKASNGSFQGVLIDAAIGGTATSGYLAASASLPTALWSIRAPRRSS